MIVCLVLEPDSINVIVNSSLQFSCTGVGDIIFFFADSTSVTSLAADGFQQTPHQDTLDESSKLIRRNLTLTSARAHLNNTMIQCYIEDSALVESNQSDIATIRIQGEIKLDHVD